MPEVKMKDIVEKQEEIASLVTDIQSEFKAKGEESDTTIKTMQDSVADLVKECGKLTTDFVKETKDREALEAIIARMSDTSETKDGFERFSDEDYTKSFNDKVRGVTEGIDLESHVKEVQNIVDFYVPNAKTEEKDFIVKTLSVGVNSTGGYFVPLDAMRKITERVFESSPMRSVASVMTTANEGVPIGLDDDEFDSGWVCEFDDRDDTDTAKLGEIILTTHEQYAYPKATTKMLEDAAFNVENWLTRKVGNKFSRTENTSFVNGDGNKKPRGFNTVDDWADNEIYERNKLAAQLTGTASTLDGDDLIDLQSLLLEPYQPRAVWAMHRKIWAFVTQLKSTDGIYLLNPMMLFQGTEMQLLGAPVKMFGDMPSTIADSGHPVAYGDFEEGYTIVDRIGIRVIKDEITKPGFVKWHFRKRVAGDITNYQAIKRLLIKPAA